VAQPAAAGLVLSVVINKNLLNRSRG